MVKNDVMLSIKELHLQVGEFKLQDISFSIEKGEYFIMLGPTGCGKTLLAETICGLNVPDSGKVCIDGKDVTHTDPAKRRIGYVPQDYALLPFKTVQANIAFGLQARKIRGKEMTKRADEILDMLELGHLRNRFPARLSGGERQRVALGRALAIRPDVLVLDEPLSALDEGTCKELMGRLKEIHSQIHATFIHICHRLEEAVTLGDTLMIMRGGIIEQRAATEDVFNRPNNLFVANFLQMPNLTGGRIRGTAHGNTFFLNNTPVGPTDLPPGNGYCVIPLKYLRVTGDKPEETEGYVVLHATIDENYSGPNGPGLRFRGEIELDVPGIFPEKDWRSGQEVFLKFPTSELHILPE